MNNKVSAVLLQTGGCLNLLIGAAHLLCLFWAKQAFALTGVSQHMERAAQSHPSMPYVLTAGMACIFFIFGLYGLSGAGKIRCLPFLWPVIFMIAGIYILRGLLGLALIAFSLPLEIVFSFCALAIGLLYLFAGCYPHGGTKMSTGKAPI